MELKLDATALLGLLDTPPMPYARCRGMHSVYDLAADGDPAAQKRALDICSHCPHLVERTRWRAESLTSRQRAALGVVGGQVYAATKQPGTRSAPASSARSSTTSTTARPKATAARNDYGPCCSSSLIPASIRRSRVSPFALAIQA
jgi:hypothetical protein